MKNIYKTAEINIVFFETKDIIVASGTEDVFTPSYTLEENEMEVLF